MPMLKGVPSSLAPNTAPRTALPQPPNTSQNVPMNSATPRFQSSMGSPLLSRLSPNGGVRLLGRLQGTGSDGKAIAGPVQCEDLSSADLRSGRSHR